MTKCPSCGAPVDGSTNECPECGASLAESTQSFAPVVPEEAESASPYAEVEGPVLVVQKGPDVGERFYLDRAAFSIGRDPHADIFLNDVTVSRKHAVVKLAGSEVSVEDAGSLNGTYVNNVLVERAILRDGDALQVGTFRMIFLAGKGA